MSSESPVIDRQEVERTLCQIAEIEAARVVNGHNNLIQELHVLASGKKAPRQIVRDIESLLMARFGIAIDHKKISIAQITDPPVEANKPAARENSPRIKIGSINIDVREHHAAVEVQLMKNRREFSGVAKGPASHNSRIRLTALATLDALAKTKENELGLALEHVSIVPAGNERVAVSCILVIKNHREETYSGAAIVRGNESDSVVRATLAAVNRTLTLQ